MSIAEPVAVPREFRSEAVMDPPLAKPATTRLISLDAYRGLTMLLMVCGALHLQELAKHVKNPAVSSALEHHLDHVAWTGGGLWDMIQPSFMFMVGVAMPFSLAS